jgi:[acyl-carrier-protein] S-malonyltransferase
VIASPFARALVERAARRHGLDLRVAGVAERDEQLRDTRLAQLVVFLLSVARAAELRAAGHTPDVVAGHSLGELSALVAGGWLDAEAALDAVVARATAMAESCAETDGTMAAVVGLDRPRLDALRAATGSAAVVANDNGPAQQVISGARVEVERLSDAARAAGARAVLTLDVDGAFHSPLMEPAQGAFAACVEALKLRVGDAVIVSSITGRVVEDPDAYRTALRTQICAPVRWREVMAVLATRCDCVVEVGPGRTLRGLMREGAPGLPVQAFERVRDREP